MGIASLSASADSGKGALVQNAGNGQQQSDSNEEEEEEETNISENDNDEAYQIIASGNCGPEGNEESVRWEVWKDGTLEIWGFGSMKDFSPTDPPPWRRHKDKIRHINIMTTNIGSYAFTGCSEVTSVYIAPDVTSIGKYAFANCTKLNHVFFKGKKDLDPNNDKKIFANCPIEEANVTVDYTGGNAFCGIFAAPLPYYPNMYDGSAQVPKIVVTSTGDYKVLPEVSPYEIMPSDETLPPDYKVEVKLTNKFGEYKEEINGTDNSDIRLPQVIEVGNCGPEGNEESVRWEFFDNGTLEIWGIGSMKDFSPTDPPPWRRHKDKIRNITMSTTHIGSYAFTGCSEVTSVYIAPNVTSTGQYAFANCTKLNYVFFEGKKDLDPNNDKKIFANCPIEEANVTVDYTGGNAFCGQKVGFFRMSIMPISDLEIAYEPFVDTPMPMPIPDWKIKISDEPFGMPTVHISDLGMADEPFGVPPKVSPLPISDLKISDEPFGVPSQIELPSIDLPYMPTQESVETNVPPDFTWKYADETWRCVAPTDIHMHTSHVRACDSPSIHETHLFKPEIKMSLDKIIAGDLESEGVLWVLRKSGKLEIFGHGLMKNYSDKERPKWEQYKDKLIRVNISGVKSIGDNAFANYNELRLLEISNDVVSIGKNAFNDCNNLSVYVVIPVSVTSIGENAFANCTKLNYVFFEGKKDLDPNNDKKIFANCPIEKIKVTDAYIDGNTFCGKRAIKMKSEADMY